jgi:uncharacterized FlaG/YvyC family protein
MLGMRRETAETIAQAMKKIDQILGQLHEVADEIDDEEEKKKLRGAFGNVILDIHENITLEVVKQFPDLHPDRRDIISPTEPSPQGGTRSPS